MYPDCGEMLKCGTEFFDFVKHERNRFLNAPIRVSPLRPQVDAWLYGHQAQYPSL